MSELENRVSIEDCVPLGRRRFTKTSVCVCGGGGGV